MFKLISSASSVSSTTTASSSSSNKSNVIEYLDWNNALDILDKAYRLGLFVLIIGPKGTGKTTLVRKFANLVNKDLSSINFSLRTRESHLIGTHTVDNGQINFMNGILVRSMTEGNLLYLDESNAAEPDVLLRLDEALDDRRQLVLKELRRTNNYCKGRLVFYWNYKSIITYRYKRTTSSNYKQISN